ncbi:hypothetical protein ABIB25_005469 [Nakamurella sp. UYEF19]|uniref:O-antigen ligase family protein n=1 Tax=Nakamurella sp. UYEF19 TaxID=1756392 RepID=UPI00339282E5
MRRTASFPLLALVVGGAVGGLTAMNPKAGLLAVALLGAVALVVLPRAAFLCAIAALPLIFSVSAGGQKITVTDIGLALALVGWLLSRRADAPTRVGVRSASGPAPVIACGIVGYGAMSVLQGLAVGSHFAVFTGLYRTAIIGIPFAVGLMWGSDHPLVRRVLMVFQVGTCALAAIWMLRFGAPSALGVNKNPGGQMMVNAAVLLLVRPKLLPLQALGLLILGGGILASESRGSLLGLVAGLMVILLARFSHGWTWRRAMAMASVGVLLVLLAPAGARERLLSQNESGQYNADIRGVFLDDALAQTTGHLAIGHGVGTYRPVNPALDRVVSLDPHNVYVLQLFEGGIPLFVMFLVLTLLPVVLLWRYRADMLVLAAISASVALLVHSAVDIYWVRGTPTFSWLLIGIAIARVAYIRHGTRVHVHRIAFGQGPRATAPEGVTR